MGHKYNRRDGTWGMHYALHDTTTIIRSCPICKYSQPLDMRALHIVDFSQCPRCKAKLDVPKKMGFIDSYKLKG